MSSIHVNSSTPGLVVELDLGRPLGTAVVVVDVQLAGLAEPLLEEPRRARHHDAVRVARPCRRSSAPRRALLRACGAAPRGRGRPARTRPVVVEDRVRDVERHRPQHVVDRVVADDALDEVGRVVVVGLDARRGREHRRRCRPCTADSSPRSARGRAARRFPARTGTACCCRRSSATPTSVTSTASCSALNASVSATSASSLARVIACQMVISTGWSAVSSASSGHSGRSGASGVFTVRHRRHPPPPASSSSPPPHAASASTSDERRTRSSGA